MRFLIGVGNMVINIVLGRQSEQAIAAIAVFRTLEGLVIGFFSGFSNAASVLVGKSVGAGELDAAYERAKRRVLLCGMQHLCAVRDTDRRAQAAADRDEPFGRIAGNRHRVDDLQRRCRHPYVQLDAERYLPIGRRCGVRTILEISFMYAVVLPCVCLTGLVWKAPFLLIFACCYIDEPIRFILMQVHMYSGKMGAARHRAWARRAACVPRKAHAP